MTPNLALLLAAQLALDAAFVSEDDDTGEFAHMLATMADDPHVN